MRIILVIPHVLVIHYLFVRLFTRKLQADEAIRRFRHVDSCEGVLLPLLPDQFVVCGRDDLRRKGLRFREELGNAVPLTCDFVPLVYSC